MFADSFLSGLNAGGVGYFDNAGNYYSPDTTGQGIPYSRDAAISGTVDDVLYQSEAYSPDGLTYEVTLENGTYYVETHFAEIYFSSAGQRVFDLSLEGVIVEDDLDVYVAAGGKNVALVTGYFVEVTDGALTIELSPEVENPKISAFGIWSVTDDPDPGPDTTAPTVVIETTGGLASDDPVQVSVHYADNVELDASTLALGDLQISGPGSYSIQSQQLTIAPDGRTATAVYEVVQTGGWSDDEVVFAVAAGAVADTSQNTNAAAEARFTAQGPFTGITPIDTYGPDDVGKVRVEITPNSGVQVSTFDSDAFVITNLGDKRVAAIYFDMTDAVFTDAVFDPLGLAGDSVARGVTYSSTGGTGAFDYSGSEILTPFYGAGGSAGYEGLAIRFDPATSGGFQTGESVAFGVDADPNSIVGIPQTPVDINGEDPRLQQWDIGGVSGAELTAMRIEVLFTDGTTASGDLFGDGSAGGAVAVIDQSATATAVSLSVNGIAPGGSGERSGTDSIIVDGPAGTTARVMMVTGFSQPFDYTAPDGSFVSTYQTLLAGGDPFLANNALEVQYVTVVLTGGSQDIAGQFDFSPPGGALAFDGDDALPFAFVAVAVDGNGDPIGPVTAPIYLQPGDGPVDPLAPTVSIVVQDADSAIAPIDVTVTYTDDSGLDLASLSLNDLTAMDNGGPMDVLWSRLDVSADGLSATARYKLMPSDGDWTGDTATLSVAQGAVADTAGNFNAAASASYAYVPPSGLEAVNSLAEMTQQALQNVSLVNPTSIDVGIDGRLYVSQQNGLIVALTVEKTVTQNGSGLDVVTWSVTAREDIDLIRDMPNHDDTGKYQPGVTDRQITGLLTTQDAVGNLVIYVSSSDPRIGGGGGGEDLDLDTNSCILSRLTQQPDGSWEKLDLVRGLPRSEENHATNGLVLTTDAAGNDVLLLTVGGFTNTGAQSHDFAYTPEYYYSASVVSIDLGKLAAIEAAGDTQVYTPPGTSESHAYLYDLPTLDDITRQNDATGGDLAGDGSTTADVFGGNDGLNQAIYDPQGIVQVVYSGFRNHYDIVVTPSGAVYTVDNGSNTGWGGVTVNAAGEPLVDLDGDGLPDNGPGVNLPLNGGAANADSLLRLDGNVWQADGAMYYGGHPNLYRAYGADAGVYLFADSTNPWNVAAGTPLTVVGGVLTPTSEPVDLAPLIPNADQISGVDAFGQPLIDPQQAVHLGTGTREEGLIDTPNGALWTFFSSTNGLDVYTAPGDMQGDLITVSFNGKIYAVEIGADGTVANVESRALTSAPLDLVAQGPADPFPGVIFVAAYGADQIVILSPDDGPGVTPDPYDRDEDGIDDTIDPFAADPDNGLVDVILPGETLLWTFVNGQTFPNDRDSIFDGTGGLYNGGDIGFTGLMTNRGGLPESLYVQDNIIFGGAPGVLQIKQVDAGDATTDTQRNGFQLGTTVGEGVTDFTVSTLIGNYLDDADLVADEKLSQGLFVGAGDQNNFVSVSLVRLADGSVGFETVSQFAFDFIGETAPTIEFVPMPELLDPNAPGVLTLYLDVDVLNATVTPRWEVPFASGSLTGTGTPVALQGDALKALEGTLTLPDDTGGQVSTGLAVGFVASRSNDGGNGGTPVIAAISSGGDESFTATIDGVVVTFVPDTQANLVTITGATKVYGTSESIDFAGTTLDELHTEERYAQDGADWGYDIATGDGTYRVDLFFAEIWSGAFAAGVRVFDVLVEGQVISANTDIYATVGAQTEMKLSVDAVVTDGVLDIDFESLTQNAKLSGLLVRDLSATGGGFTANFDDLAIQGFGTPPPDETAPTIAMSVSGGVISDDPVVVTVDYADEAALDQSTLSLGDMTIGGSGTYDIIQSDLTVDPNVTTATAIYYVTQVGGWTEDPVTFSVADAAVADTSGNLSSAAQTQFIYNAPDPDTTPPVATVSVSHNGAMSASDPVTVTVLYTDETGLDASTLALEDLTITGAGSYVTSNEDLTIAGDGLSATATYTVTQSGGWTEEIVTFSVEAGAVEDTSGNGSTAAQDQFQFQPPSDGFVFALNAGGGAYTDANGVVYAADTFGVGNAWSTSHAIAGTAEDALYQTEVWKDGGFTYDIALDNGTYRVDMHFAENYAPNDAVGDRVFDVMIEDLLILDQFDILKEAGGQYTAYTTSAVVEVTDGSLTMTMIDLIENPKINAFSIWDDAIA